MPERYRCVFGGWVREPGQQNMLRPKVDIVRVPQTQESLDFAERSRARWDILEYLKVNLRQALRRRASGKH